MWPMKRRAVGRDLGLILRMLLAIGLLGAFYARESPWE
jgi:hypothetical protein